MRHFQRSVLAHTLISQPQALDKAVAGAMVLLEEDVSTQSHLLALRHAQESFSSLLSSRKGSFSSCDYVNTLALMDLFLQKLAKENEDAYIIPQLHKVNERYSNSLKATTSLFGMSIGFCAYVE